MSIQIFRADSLKSAHSLRKEYPDARFLAGGTDLIPRINQGIESPSGLILLEGIPELGGIRAEDGFLSIGALCRLSDLSEHPLLKAYPSLTAAASRAASPQIRNQGTIGGNILQENRCMYFNQSVSWKRDQDCFKLGGTRCMQYRKSPECVALFQSDLAPVLISLKGSAVLCSESGERIVPVENLYLPAGKKNLQPEEVLTRIRIPLYADPFHLRTAYVRKTIRKAIDFPLISCALSVVMRNGIVESARAVMGSAGVMPQIVWEAEDCLSGLHPDQLSGQKEVLKTAVSAKISPFRDIRTDAVVRKALALQALEEALQEICTEQHSL